MNIQEYIESGILEAYVLGSASEAEARELLYLKDKHPEIRQALQELEMDMEHIAEQMAVPPPPLTWMKIEAELNNIIPQPQSKPLLRGQNEYRDHRQFNSQKQNQYIEVEAESTHMRVHKAWKWVFGAVFILGKIFLIFAIYFYLENKHAQEQIQELKTELHLKRVQP